MELQDGDWEMGVGGRGSGDEYVSQMVRVRDWYSGKEDSRHGNLG